MPHYSMPIDKNSSMALLGKFMENAMNKTLKNHFLKAVEIVYGKSFDIRLDISQRMYFFCMVCNKDMNSVKSLDDHKLSGNHIKNEDSVQHDKRILIKHESKRRNFKPDTLQSKLQNAAVKVIGLQNIEGFNNGKRTYFKCNLCGAHGKADAMYNHIIGTNHTDKYIKMRIVLNNPFFDAKTREYYRNAISHSEPYSVDDIIIIKGKDYYPTKWEEETFRARQKPKKRKEFEYKSSDAKETPEIKSVATISKLNITEPKDKDKQQCLSYPSFNKILLKCNVIVKTHLEDCTDLRSYKDLEMAVKLMFYVLHLLHYANRGLLKREGKNCKALEEQKKSLSSCMGYIHDRIMKKMREENEEVKV